MKNEIIRIEGIKPLYKEYCKENKVRFSKKSLEMFLVFLEIDFYDWIKENLRQFEMQ